MVAKKKSKKDANGDRKARTGPISPTLLVEQSAELNELAQQIETVAQAMTKLEVYEMKIDGVNKFAACKKAAREYIATVKYFLELSKADE